MRRTVVILVSVAVFAGAVAALPVTGGAQPASDSPSVAPGEQFAGVVNVQEAEVEGELKSRTFEVRLGKASSPNAKAALVAEQQARNSERLAELEAEIDQLRTARANGEIREGTFRARLAKLVAEARAVERLNGQSADVASTLSEETLQEHGVNATRLQTLRSNAGSLGGQDVAKLAREIAGPDAGTQLKDRVERGQPDDGGSDDVGDPDSDDSNRTVPPNATRDETPTANDTVETTDRPGSEPTNGTATDDDEQQPGDGRPLPPNSPQELDPAA